MTSATAVSASTATPPTPTSPAPAATPRPDFNGKLFAKVSIPKYVDPLLMATTPLGADAGYTTLTGAMNVLAKTTDGDAPASAIFEKDGRFYGQSAVSTLGGQDEPFHLDPDWRKEYELKLGTNVSAIVDGPVTIVNDGTHPKWWTPSRLYHQLVEDSYRKPPRPL